MDRHRKVFFDGVEVGRIQADLKKEDNPTGGESYTISGAAYGVQVSPLFHVSSVADPTSVVDIVLLVVISLCLNDRHHEG